MAIVKLVVSRTQVLGTSECYYESRGTEFRAYHHLQDSFLQDNDSIDVIVYC